MSSNNSKNQGEGNREAAKEYNKDQQEFVESGGVDENQDQHRDMSSEELEKARAAAEKAKQKARK